MIPPQLIAMAAKYGKWILVGGVFLLLAFAVWLAFEYHGSIVEENGQLQASAAEKDLALRVSITTGEAKDAAIQKWKESAEQLKLTLAAQHKAQQNIRKEMRVLNESISGTRLEAMALRDAESVERTLNADTSYLQCLHACATTPGGCRCTRAGATPGATDDSLPGPGLADPVPLEGASTGSREVSENGSILPAAGILRDPIAQPNGTLALGARGDASIGVLPR